MRRRVGFVGLTAVGAGFWLSIGLAAPPPSDDDDERAAARQAARRAVDENCLICHDASLITSQRLTPAQWKTEVEKMVGWGSPLPAELRDPVIAYLTAEYPPVAPAPVLERRPLANLPEATRPVLDAAAARDGSPERGRGLYATQCANCHGPDGLGADLGPNLVEKPVLARPEEYHEVVRKGRGRMPGFSAALNSDQDSDVLAWLRSRRFEPPRRP